MVWWIVTALMAVIIDQLTKYIVVVFLKPIGYVPLWQDVLHLTYVENKGAAFGMLENHRWVFMSISAIAIIAMIIFMFVYRSKSVLFNISTGLIIGGGIGNMIDRLVNGFVVDFIDFTLIDFAVFNGADSCVCVGAVLLFIYILFIEGKSKGKIDNEKNSPDAERSGSQQQN
jgi:lipoprotein signal peptidase